MIVTVASSGVCILSCITRKWQEKHCLILLIVSEISLFLHVHCSSFFTALYIPLYIFVSLFVFMLIFIYIVNSYYCLIFSKYPVIYLYLSIYMYNHLQITIGISNIYCDIHSIVLLQWTVIFDSIISMNCHRRASNSISTLVLINISI